ncbi:hypothetical protein E9232_004634 [Inquilinus ginsengisoli]|uniref:Uncharacterized protein n=1 Tax=Inquilinus ginsengisoli TaxID=363840 RepID=A0ABU1JTZ2_9PROT|nr:hypothetical protein [Inquilinus ginsengisoli]MDR6292096.1 hypothetical protein [Inquilinus ginsengisoli]
MLPIIDTIAASLHGCNLHFCLYAAFGAATIVRASVAARGKDLDEKREHIVAGLTHIIIAILTL